MENLRGYLKITEAAEFLGVTAQTLRNWDRRGEFPSFRHPINGYRLYRRADLMSFLNKVDTSGRNAK